MQKEILDFLRTKRLGVLSVEMMDGSPHGATVHFSLDESSSVFYFETNKEYKKSESLLGRSSSRASFVVGVDEVNLQTLQVDGEVSLLTPEEWEIFQKVYLTKFPDKVAKSTDPKYLFFKLIPKWWRFTDWANPTGKQILNS